MVFPLSNWYRRFKAVADPDLQIRGGGVVWKKIFSTLRASVSSKNKGGAFPGYATAKFSREKGPSDHACTLQCFGCLTPKKGQDWLPHFELFQTVSFHGKTFEVCFPYFNLMWLCSSCRMRSSLPRLECLPSHWGNSILCPMPPLIRSDGITQDIMA